MNMLSKPLNEWDVLKKRYGSNRQYAQRKVLSNKSHFHDFVEFLIHKGADISGKPAQDEALRFHLNGEIGEANTVQYKKSGLVIPSLIVIAMCLGGVVNCAGFQSSVAKVGVKQ